MTWEQLGKYINNLTPEQRQTNVTLHDQIDDEFIRLDSFVGNWKDFYPDGDCPADGVLDDNHPFLAF